MSSWHITDQIPHQRASLPVCGSDTCSYHNMESSLSYIVTIRHISDLSDLSIFLKVIKSLNANNFFVVPDAIY